MDTDTHLNPLFTPNLFPVTRVGIDSYHYSRDDVSLLVDAYLSFGDYYGIQETQTAVSPIGMSREQIASFLEFALWRDAFLSGCSDIDKEDIVLEQAVVSEFASISDIAMIYVEKYRSEYIFKLFIRSDFYTDVFMDILLEREFDILERYNDLPMVFHYLPYSTNVHLKSFVSDTARLIFRG